jgi:hypothetical protein
MKVWINKDSGIAVVESGQNETGLSEVLGVLDEWEHHEMTLHMPLEDALTMSACREHSLKANDFKRIEADPMAIETILTSF